MKAGSLKPGMVGVNLKGTFDPMGTIDTVLQGDTDAAHVWWVLPSGRIATTGAVSGILYGERDAAEYLKGKKFFLLETIDTIPNDKLAIMQHCHEQMLHSGIKRFYGIWKFLWLEWLAAIDGSVTKTGLKPKTSVPEFPICSQALAYCFWSAGMPIGAAQGKEDWTAVLPETILAEAKEVSFRLDALLLGKRPCYYLKLVEPLPFSG
jgi:hypothetical protein